jgi:putative effector of murein hydrolase LrgA (UPF0299 family)
MVNAFLLLIGAELVGMALQSLLHLPLPGAVTGLFLLAILLALRPALRTGGLNDVAGGLLRHMGLLFVPAGVGVVDHLDLIATEGVPLAAGLIGSTLLTLVVTALVMEWHDKIAIRLPGGRHVRNAVR